MLKQNFCLRKNINLNILFRFSSVSLGIFLFLTIFPPVIKEKLASAIIDDDEYALALTNSGDINLTINPTSKDTAIAKSVITANTTSPAGYKLYVSTDNEETSDIHLSGYEDYDDADKKIATTSGSIDTPTALSDTGSSWGFAIPGMNNFDPVYNTEDATVGTKFAAVPTKYNEQLIHEHTGIANDDRTEVYYAFKADNNLTAGNYNTTILYTTLSEATSDDVTEIIIETEKDLIENYTGETAIMKTSIMSSRRISGIEIEVNDIPAEEVTVINAMPLELSFEIPEGLAVGDYDTELTIASISRSYTIPDSIHIHPAVPTSMQDMTPEYCDYIAVGTQFQLTDVRDNKTYWVGKLADGECWMTQNLDLRLDTSVTLTNDTTDLNSKTSWTPNETAHNTEDSNKRPTWSTTYTYTSNKSYDVGDYYYVTKLSGTSRDFTGQSRDKYDPGGDRSVLGYGCRTIKYCYNSKKTEYGFTTTIQQDKHTHVGDYYTFTAAVASNDSSDLVNQEAPDSICPRGWKLPSSTQYSALLAEYTNASKLVDSPFYSTRSGMFDINAQLSLSWAYVDVDYWTSTVNSSKNAYRLYGVDNIMLTPTAQGNGNTIRCIMRRDSTSTKSVAKAQTNKTSNIVYNTNTMQGKILDMQDVENWKDELIEGEQVRVKDTRDGKLYWVAKLADGEVWMTQNLDYDIVEGANIASTLDNNTIEWSTSTSTSTEVDTLLSDSDVWSYDITGGMIDSDAIKCQDGEPDSYNLCHFHAGNLYTWNAATAGTGNSAANNEATASICPKGWRLPTNGSATTDKSFAKLFNSYSITATNTDSLYTGPFYMIGSGYAYAGQLYSSYTEYDTDMESLVQQREVPGYGAYWTASGDPNSSRAFSLGINNEGYLEPSRTDLHSYAYAVRCVAL